MPTAEMRISPQLPSAKSPNMVHVPAPDLFASPWMKAGIWLLAFASLGASLAYTGTVNRSPSAAYALDRDWAASSPLGVDPKAETMSPLAVPTPACAVCGRVEAVLVIPPGQAGRTKEVFEIRVRMEDGHIQTVHVEKRLAVGTAVTLAHGVLRPDNA